MIGVINSHTGITLAGFPSSIPIEILKTTSQNRPQVLILAG
jgi:hypothetical protein